MILKSARKSSDAHTWGFKNGVVMTTLSSGCRATARYFTVAGSFLFHGFSRPVPPGSPMRATWQSGAPIPESDATIRKSQVLYDSGVRFGDRAPDFPIG
jgi:hypothetical protein